MSIFIVFATLLIFLQDFVSGTNANKDGFLYDIFPPDFQWGYASSSYQIEGAWREDGKGLSIWDEFTHRNPSPIDDGSTADVTCDSYHNYPEDVSLLKFFGAGVYRFSLSWSRILPRGRITYINPAGIRYYNNLINLLVANNIEPLITIHHWDLPQALMDIGGWPNDEVIHHYTDFAYLVFSMFGDRVKKWVTFNEPNLMCINGYFTGIYAPGHKNFDETKKCVHNVIKSHARAYRLYDKVFRSSQGGKVGMGLISYWCEPSDSKNHHHNRLAEFVLQIQWGSFAHPIVFGRYPPEYSQAISNIAKKLGIASPPLEFTLAESVEIRGTWDFWGLNQYGTFLVGKTSSNIDSGISDLFGVGLSTHHTWPNTSVPENYVVPWGLRKLLGWIRDKYGNPDIYVLENGYADRTDVGLQDYDKVAFHRDYINEMLKSVRIDGVNVRMYTAWTLLDSFEWKLGYSVSFGVVAVNYSDPRRQRTPKLSAFCLKQIYTDNGFPK